ncbi:MAG: GNAT family N-acetyltransferase [Planctomycetota bacterium]
MTTVTLRELTEKDRLVLFGFQQDPEANHMAAFTSEDPTDEAAHHKWWDMIMGNGGITKRGILSDGALVGSVLTFTMDGQLEVTYWIAKPHWGKGIATEALRQLLQIVDQRPIYARAATDNKGSLRVLDKCGFVVCAEEQGFANARGAEIAEYVLRKDDA